MKRTYKYIISSFFALSLFIVLGGIESVAFGQAQQPKQPDKENNVHITNQRELLTVYPMPVNGKVHIRLSSALCRKVDKIQIISMIGRKMTEQKLIDPTNTHDVSFSNLEDYPEGVYMVLARNKYGKIIKSAKMIVSH